MNLILPPERDGTIDAHCILPSQEAHGSLWQGSRPPQGDTLASLGYDLVVLCAIDYQPPARKFIGVDVWHIPFEDDFHSHMPRPVLKSVFHAADKVRAHLLRGDKVLVTCWAGINRSGLVSAVSLHKLLGMSGSDAAHLIKFKRPGALSNPLFNQMLGQLPEKTLPR